MSKTISSIENSLLLGCDVRFKKTFGPYFNITVYKEEDNKFVELPLSDHLTDEKVASCINLLTQDLIK